MRLSCAASARSNAGRRAALVSCPARLVSCSSLPPSLPPACLRLALPLPDPLVAAPCRVRRMLLSLLASASDLCALSRCALSRCCKTPTASTLFLRRVLRLFPLVSARMRGQPSLGARCMHACAPAALAASALVPVDGVASSWRARAGHARPAPAHARRVPCFVQGVQVKPSVLHGDLWSGNIGMHTSTGEEGRRQTVRCVLAAGGVVRSRCVPLPAAPAAVWRCLCAGSCMPLVCSLACCLVGRVLRSVVRCVAC